MRDVLTLVDQSTCLAYDCEFVALARNFDIKMVNMHRRVIDVFLDTAVSLGDFMADRK